MNMLQLLWEWRRRRQEALQRAIRRILRLRQQQEPQEPEGQAYLVLSDLEVDEGKRAIPGKLITAIVTVTNEGDRTSPAQYIGGVIAGAGVANETRELRPGESQRLGFTHVLQANCKPGTFDVVIRGPNNTLEGEITLLEGEIAPID